MDLRYEPHQLIIRSTVWNDHVDEYLYVRPANRIIYTLGKRVGDRSRMFVVLSNIAANSLIWSLLVFYDTRRMICGGSILYSVSHPHFTVNGFL